MNLDDVVKQAKKRVHARIDNDTGRIKIESDGTPFGTRCFINGVMVDGITSLHVLCEPNKPVKVHMTAINPEVVINGKVKTDSLLLHCINDLR